MAFGLGSEFCISWSSNHALVTLTKGFDMTDFSPGFNLAVASGILFCTSTQLYDFDECHRSCNDGLFAAIVVGLCRYQFGMRLHSLFLRVHFLHHWIFSVLTPSILGFLPIGQRRARYAAI